MNRSETKGTSQGVMDLVIQLASNEALKISREQCVAQVLLHAAVMRNIHDYAEHKDFS